MAYRIVVDSCTDLTKELKENKHIVSVPLILQVDEDIIIDDDTFNQADFLKKVAASPNCPKSSCPAPDAYMQYYDCEEEDVYVVTLSSNLSGSFNSAELGKKLYLEEHPNKNIEVINSCCATVGQTLIVIKLLELINSGKTFQEIVPLINAYRDEETTKFVLENLDTLRKAGRLTGLKSVITNVLNIKPIMGSTPEGTICKIDQARGIQKALLSMIRIIEQDVKNASEKVVGIAHCNNYERALFVKNELLKRIPFKDCIIVETGGVSTLYACEGGIVISY